MNQLSEIQIENKSDVGLVVSSRVVAGEVNKRHSDVINQIERLLENENVRSLIIPNQYQVEGQKRKYKEYLLTKDGFTLYMFNIQGHNDFKMAYINKFNEMENQLQNLLPGTYKEAVAQLLESLEENENLKLENTAQHQKIGELQPKADYHDLILKNKSLVTISQIAKDYGMSAQALNRKLHELKVQYKQSGQWLLYSQLHDKGYTSSSTTEIEHKDGTTSIKMNTKWTQKGRLFLYQLLKDNDVIPMIERGD